MREIIIAVSGIILFLIGMIRLSSAVQKLINVRIKQYVKYAVEKPVYGFFTGVISTIILQSSSASTALTIGLVSAGLISFSSSLAIILGTDIGTTLTVQFVVWRFTEISPIFISLGGLFWLIGKGRWRLIGEMIFYFGMIFFGLEIVSQAVEPIKKSPALLQILTQTTTPLIGIILGVVITGIIHASAIPISIMVLLAQHDLVSLENAIPVILGANIGTTATALLAGAVATINGRRSAISHLIFKFVGVTVCFIFMSYFTAILKNVSPSVPQQIVLAHFLLNLVIVFIFIFMLGPYSAIMKKMLPDDNKILPIWPEYLDHKDISNPQKALDNVQKELQREIYLVQKMFLNALDLIAFYQEGKKRDGLYIEMVVNNLRAQIVKYLLKVSAQQLSAELSKKVFAFTAMAGDIESIGNHIVNMNDLTAQKEEKNIKFSEFGENELQEIISLVSRNLEDSLCLIEVPNGAKIKGVIKREEEVDIKVKEARDNHLKRFHNRLCDPEAGPYFVELLIRLERISDHCTNIAEYVSDI